MFGRAEGRTRATKRFCPVQSGVRVGGVDGVACRSGVVRSPRGPGGVLDVGTLVGRTVRRAGNVGVALGGGVGRTEGVRTGVRILGCTGTAGPGPAGCGTSARGSPATTVTATAPATAAEAAAAATRPRTRRRRAPAITRAG